MNNILTLFAFLPDLKNLSKFQRQEYAKVWFHISVVMFGSLVIKIFEPGNQKITIDSLITVLAGLLLFFLCVKVGLHIGKKI